VAQFYLAKGDSLPTLTGVLANPDLSACDLTNATVTLGMTRMSTGERLELAAEIVGDPTRGMVQHTWQAGESDTSGACFYRWQVTWPDGREETFPNDSRGLVLSVSA
jgi:hypothetical protein